MKAHLLFFLFLINNFFSIAQDVKSLDYAKQYSRHHARTRICKEVRYKANHAVDSTMLGIASFDKNGRVIHYTEFFSAGKKMAEYSYSYDEAGKMVKSDVSLVFNNWQPLEFELKHDAKGRLISRELKNVMANFWKRETFSYNADVLIKTEQWYEVNGLLEVKSHKDYPPTLDIRENSLTFILDAKGLLMLHQLMNGRGQVERALVYNYEFYY